MGTQDSQSSQKFNDHHWFIKKSFNMLCWVLDVSKNILTDPPISMKIA